MLAPWEIEKETRHHRAHQLHHWSHWAAYAVYYFLTAAENFLSLHSLIGCVLLVLLVAGAVIGSEEV